MNKSTLKATAVAAIIGLCISAILLVISFVLPEVYVNKLRSQALPLVDAASNAIYANDYEAVTEYAKRLYEAVSDYESKLEFFTHHKDISTLLNAADSAVKLAYISDAAQLLEELSDIRYMLDYLAHINEISLSSVI